VPDPSTCILDTDTLSAVMRNVPVAVLRAGTYLAEQGKFTFSVITRYEILRGLMAKSADSQIGAFGRFCEASETLYLTDAVVERAAAIYAELRKAGPLIGDADILIAATALEKGAGLVTNNGRHFKRIPGLCVENWLG
jgi:tRNA(fMet)-specific endonuclease VapC